MYIGIVVYGVRMGKAFFVAREGSTPRMRRRRYVTPEPKVADGPGARCR